MRQAENGNEFPIDNDQRGFIRGFVLGQTTAYIEQVSAGAKLAAQLGCASEYADDVIGAAEGEGCETIVEDRGNGRVAIWIFRTGFVRSLIEELSKKATPPTASEVWAVGKLFGYSDSEVGNYLQSHGLLRSVSDSESSPLPFEDRSGWRTEQKCRPG